MSYLAIRETGDRIVRKGDILRSSRGEDWTFQMVIHPRKVFVTAKDDPNGPDSYPNMESREFYADVFNLGIWDIDTKEWTFEPSWDHTDITSILRGETPKASIYQLQSTYKYSVLTARLVRNADKLRNDAIGDEEEMMNAIRIIEASTAELRQMLETR